MNTIADLNDALNTAFLKDISVCKKKGKDLRDIAEETVYAHMPQAGMAWILLDDGSNFHGASVDYNQRLITTVKSVEDLHNKVIAPLIQVSFVKTQDGFKFEGLPRTFNVISVYTGDIVAAAIVYGVLGLSNKAAADRMAVLKKSPLFEKAEAEG